MERAIFLSDGFSYALNEQEYVKRLATRSMTLGFFSPLMQHKSWGYATRS